MPSIDQMIESKYLKQSDITRDTLVTVGTVTRTNLAKDGAIPEYKYTISFDELPKPMVLNVTNMKVLGEICGSKHSEEWQGKKVVLYVKDDVEYGGKVTGGLRIRKPRVQGVPEAPVAQSRVRPESGDGFQDDIPF